jgi:hypothetical protein
MLGDSLRARIGAGLSHSQVGVVILSRSFFAKQWSRWELSGLTARQIAGEENVILPVWHDLELDDVRSYSPPLADLVAVRSGDGVRAVADAVGRVVRMRAAGAERADALEVADGSTRARPRPRRATAIGALAVAAVTAILAAINPFDGGDRGTAQSTSRSAFVLPSGSVTLAGWPRKTVGECVLFEGRARLKVGRTLLIGARRVKPSDSRTYYQDVAWNGADGRSTWWATRSFGSERGQTYRVTVVAIQATDVRAIRDSGKLSADAEVERLRPDVMQTSHAKGCRGAADRS